MFFVQDKPTEPTPFCFALTSTYSLEMLDKVEPPSIPEGYAMSVAFSALLDLVRGITTMIERELSMEEEAAVDFREAHPDKEWHLRPGENCKLYQSSRCAKGIQFVNYKMQQVVKEICMSCLCMTVRLPLGGITSVTSAGQYCNHVITCDSLVLNVKSNADVKLPLYELKCFVCLRSPPGVGGDG